MRKSDMETAISNVINEYVDAAVEVAFENLDEKVSERIDEVIKDRASDIDMEQIISDNIDMKDYVADRVLDYFSEGDFAAALKYNADFKNEVVVAVRDAMGTKVDDVESEFQDHRDWAEAKIFELLESIGALEVKVLELSTPWYTKAYRSIERVVRAWIS